VVLGGVALAMIGPGGADRMAAGSVALRGSGPIEITLMAPPRPSMSSTRIAVPKPPAASAPAAVPLPRVLSAADVARYRRIFDHQENEAWEAADWEMRHLDDRLLVGHVLFERYMHPTGYRSRFAELQDWLKRHDDHPGAPRLYRLALRRQAEGAEKPRQPGNPNKGVLLAAAVSPAVATAPRRATAPKRSKADRNAVKALQRQITNNLDNGRITVTARLLRRKHVRRLLSPSEFDRAQAKVAAAYYYIGRDELALKLARASAERSRAAVPLADWTAGLAAWRLGDIAGAGAHFEALAGARAASGWNVAAGAYWAARAHRALGREADAERLLRRATDHPRTFYGLLAARQLAEEPPLAWREPPLTGEHLARLTAVPGARRAIALDRVGRTDLAEQEIRALYPRADVALGHALLALADRLEIASVQLRLGRILLTPGSPYYDNANYPLPPWRPDDGFAIDRALVYAFMRRESGFSSRAKSRAGARGLMQLMPITASYVAKDKSLRGRNKSKLYSPEFNLDLGQSYLKHLLGTDTVNGNLFLLAVAYNAGPGNLRKWLKSTRHLDDSLLFIESLPLLETRIFVERVLTNFWIYRSRLGQDLPSIDAVVNDNWPYYIAQDPVSMVVASNARN
jgi:soluble lytic murein transglycosylase-like protein